MLAFFFFFFRVFVFDLVTIFIFLGHLQLIRMESYFLKCGCFSFSTGF